MTKPLLSIVIPTRNRQKCALSAIKGILKIKSNDFELIIQDNSDTNELSAQIINYKNDSRLRYIYIPETLSFVDNFFLAFQQAKGEYVCSLGDDDFINPEVLQACAWARENGVDAISDGRWGTQYFWPGFGLENPSLGESGRLQIRKFSGKMKILDPESELRRCIRSGGMSLQRLPRPYIGVIKRECLAEALRCAAVSPVGTCPDMFYAVSVAAFMKRICVLDYPLVIAGYSPASAGQLIVLHCHQGRLEDAPHLRGRKNFEWPAVIPRFYSVNTFYAESALRGLQAVGRNDLIKKFNFPFLYVMCAILNPEYLKETLASLRIVPKAINQSYLRFAARFIFDLSGLLWMLAVKRIQAGSLRPGMTKVDVQLDNINTSEEAMYALVDYLQKTKRRFDDHI